MEKIIIKGTIIKGDRIGRRLGFPTANIALDKDDAVKNGVYAARATIFGESYNGMASVGYRPTISEVEKREIKVRRLEVNFFDFNDDLYGKELEIELLKYIRPEQTFPSLELLREMVDNDKIEIENYFKTHKD